MTRLLVEPVIRIPVGFHPSLIACDVCGVIPSDEDGALQLSMVTTPEGRKFLGPTCLAGERAKWEGA